jgi:hypothetical protein
MSAILRGVAASDTTPLHARKADNTMMRGEAMAGVEVSRAETGSGLGPAVTWEDPPVWPGGPASPKEL